VNRGKEGKGEEQTIPCKPMCFAQRTCGEKRGSFCGKGGEVVGPNEKEKGGPSSGAFNAQGKTPLFREGGGANLEFGRRFSGRREKKEKKGAHKTSLGKKNDFFSGKKNGTRPSLREKKKKNRFFSGKKKIKMKKKGSKKDCSLVQSNCIRGEKKRGPPLERVTKPPGYLGRVDRKRGSHVVRGGEKKMHRHEGKRKGPGFNQGKRERFPRGPG